MIDDQQSEAPAADKLKAAEATRRQPEQKALPEIPAKRVINEPGAHGRILRLCDLVPDGAGFCPCCGEHV